MARHSIDNRALVQILRVGKKLRISDMARPAATWGFADDVSAKFLILLISTILSRYVGSGGGYRCLIPFWIVRLHDQTIHDCLIDTVQSDALGM